MKPRLHILKISIFSLYHVNLLMPEHIYPIMAMGCRQCLPLRVFQHKGKLCRKPHCRNGVVDTFGQSVHKYCLCDFAEVLEYFRRSDCDVIWWKNDYFQYCLFQKIWTNYNTVSLLWLSRFFLKQTLYTNVVSCAKRSQNLESYLMQDPVQIVHKEMVHFGAMEIANGLIVNVSKKLLEVCI